MPGLLQMSALNAKVSIGGDPEIDISKLMQNEK